MDVVTLITVSTATNTKCVTITLTTFVTNTDITSTTITTITAATHIVINTADVGADADVDTETVMANDRLWLHQNQSNSLMHMHQKCWQLLRRWTVMFVLISMDMVSEESSMV